MKYNLLSFAIGVLLGIFIGLVYCTASLGSNGLPVSVPSPKELTKEVVKTETGYAKSFDTLKRANEKLDAEIIAAKSELQKAKQKSHALQLEVYAILDKRFEKQREDTVATQTNCDTLVATVADLINANTQKDTLYEQVTRNLEEQVKNRDTTLALKDVQYSNLKTSFAKSIQSTELLTEQNKALNKQYKKQKIKSKLLSAVLFALSGAAATYFIHH